MKTLLRIGLCCMLASCLTAQRGGGGHGAGGLHGGGGAGRGFRGGVGMGGGFRGGHFNDGRGFGNGFGRGFYSGIGYWPGVYGGFGYYGSPYYGYWDDPAFSSYSPYLSANPSYSTGYAAPTEYSPSPNVTIIYPAAPQAQSVYVPPTQPVMRSYDQYGQEAQQAAPASGPGSGSPIYLIALKDQTIRAAAAYWVDGRTLHYVTLQHEEKQAPLDAVDRSLSLQLNRERRVAFQLPL